MDSEQLTDADAEWPGVVWLDELPLVIELVVGRLCSLLLVELDWILER